MKPFLSGRCPKFILTVNCAKNIKNLFNQLKIVFLLTKIFTGCIITKKNIKTVNETDVNKISIQRIKPVG